MTFQQLCDSKIIRIPVQHLNQNVLITLDFTRWDLGIEGDSNRSHVNVTYMDLSLLNLQSCRISSTLVLKEVNKVIKFIRKTFQLFRLRKDFTIEINEKVFIESKKCSFAVTALTDFETKCTLFSFLSISILLESVSKRNGNQYERLTDKEKLDCLKNIATNKIIQLGKKFHILLAHLCIYGELNETT